LLKSNKILNPITHTLSFEKNIKFSNVSFAYNENNIVFSGFSFTINKGETVGVIGPSGSGKSTLMLLMLGVLQPNKGEILIDDVPLSKDLVDEWHKLVGIVPQEVFIMDGNIAENITLTSSSEEIDNVALNKALELSSLNEMIASMPDGVNTYLEDRGNNLSGGQKQRIAIARSVYNGSKVIVFDEATSALDMETEKEIKNAIAYLKQQGYTIVIIAHRYTTLAHCDHIVEITPSSYQFISKEELKRRIDDSF
jgi:ATP-binding cassette, subfamily B, bacterial PglK